MALRLTASASPLTRLEAGAARKAAALMQDARDRAMLSLSDGYRPRGGRTDEYDVVFARSRKASLLTEVDRLEVDLRHWLESDISEAASLAVSEVAKTSGLDVRLDRGVLGISIEMASDHVAAEMQKMRAAVRRAVTQAIGGALSHGEFVREVRMAIGGGDAIERMQRVERLQVNQGHQQQRAAMDEQLAALGSDLIKVWATEQDDLVRDSHAAIEGQERELRALFNVGDGATMETGPRSKVGHKANGPLDPSLPAQELYNCRCRVLYRKRKDARQSYISATPKGSRSAPSRRSRASIDPAAIGRLLTAAPASRMVAPGLSRLVARSR